MGVESGSQQVLDAMDKGLLISEVVEARQRLRRSWDPRLLLFAVWISRRGPGTIFSRPIASSRTTRPDDIGVSVSYPLPNTRFYEKVQAELGRKRNWTDSDDLCVMFKADYNDEFYHALRDALHAEVDSWHGQLSAPTQVTRLWQRVAELEPVSRNPDATRFSFGGNEIATARPSRSFCPFANCLHAAREA